MPENAETVEIWHQISDRRIDAHVWVYDPEFLEEPWFTRRRYVKLTNDNREIRIRYWARGENRNNDITETANGGSTFTDFDFTHQDDTKKK